MGEAVLSLVRPQGRHTSGEWSSSDVQALTNFWNNLEASCGVKSTMEGQIAMLNRRSISDGSKADAAAEKRRGRVFKRKDFAVIAAKLPSATSILLDHLGIEPVLEPGQPTPKEFADLVAGIFPEQLIHINESSSGPIVDPYENDAMLRDICESRTIRSRLMSVSSHCVGVLYAAYGPMRGDTDRNNGLRKKFGDPLIEIVVGLIWMAHDKMSIPAAREMAFWKAKDESFVTMQKRQAQKILDAAHVEYGKAKLSWK